MFTNSSFGSNNNFPLRESERSYVSNTTGSKSL